jgi:hypothetical protein
MKLKTTHGGARKGAGRKPGSGKKEPTTVMRVPLVLKPKIEKLIETWRNKHH